MYNDCYDTILQHFDGVYSMDLRILHDINWRLGRRVVCFFSLP